MHAQLLRLFVSTQAFFVSHTHHRSHDPACWLCVSYILHSYVTTLRHSLQVVPEVVLQRGGIRADTRTGYCKTADCRIIANQLWNTHIISLWKDSAAHPTKRSHPSKIYQRRADRNIAGITSQAAAKTYLLEGAYPPQPDLQKTIIFYLQHSRSESDLPGAVPIVPNASQDRTTRKAPSTPGCNTAASSCVI